MSKQVELREPPKEEEEEGLHEQKCQRHQVYMAHQINQAGLIVAPRN